MKKVLILAAAVCLTACLSQASIFSCWLTTDWTPDVTPGNDFTVTVWAQILADPGIPGEQISHSGMHDMAITIYTPGTVNVAVPDPNSDDFCDWGGALGNWGTKISPAVQDYDHDGDTDNVEMAPATTDNNATGSKGTIGVSAIIVATQAWTLQQNHVATLQVFVNRASRHFVQNTTTGAVAYYSGFREGSAQVGQEAVPPTIALTPPSQKVNTTARGGTTASVSLTVSELAGDPVTAGTLFYGDGGSDGLTSLPFTGTHTYSIGTYTASANASNAGGGSNTPTASVQVVQAPTIVLVVNGAMVAFPGEIFSGPAFWGHNTVTLDLLDSGHPSTGYITAYHIVNPTTGLNVTTSSWSGDSYSLYGAAVTCTVSNDGSGLNSDQISVQFIPEPATMALLAVGAVGALIRRRK